ncbi:MAG: cytochrome c-type biogenesis protein CcmH [Conexibacteraceae bacterium]|nr:cytochrome c-type biogenesis protein CcmH [Conexibacteraceae bacterium]
MRLGRVVATALVALALGAATGATAAAATVNYSSVVSQFMCVSCHEPLELVNSPQAISEKQTLQGFVNRGLTMSQIKTAMVGQYGPAVLARPPASGFNLTIYIMPPAIFVAGLALLIFTLPKWRRRARAVQPLAGTDELPAAEASRLDDELSRFI